MSPPRRTPSWEVEVDGRAYLWSIDREAGYMWVTVVEKPGTGQRLVVGVVADDMRVPVPGGGARTTRRKSVTPHLVRIVIERALKLGWKPRKKRRELRFRLVGDELVREKDL